VNFDGTIRRTACIGKLPQHIIADKVDDASVEFQERYRDAVAAGLPASDGVNLVFGHQSAVVNDIGAYRGGQATLRSIFGN
jgi:hypothetical protein